jgi:hypothetical protein
MVASRVLVARVEGPVVRRVIPGRSVPEGVTPSAEDSVLEWLKSHEGRVGANAVAYAAKMEGGGYDDLYNIGFDFGDLVKLGIPEGHAKTIATNAVHISRKLGSVDAKSDTPMSREYRGAIVAYPSSVEGVRGMPSKKAMHTYAVRLAGWARGWSEELAVVIDDLLRDPTGTGVGDAQSRVSAQDDMYLASDLTPTLSDKALGLLGKLTIRGGSGIAMLHKLFVPYFGMGGAADKALLKSVTHPKVCKNIDELYECVEVWDNARVEYSMNSSNTINDDQLEVILEAIYDGVESMKVDVDNLRENWHIMTPHETLSFADLHSFVHSKAFKVYQKNLDKPKPKSTPKPPPKANLVAPGVAQGSPIVPGNSSASEPVKDCIDWQLEGCKYGNSCVFKHDPTTKGKGHENGLTARLAVMAARPCYAFKEGTCRRGEACRFSHGELHEVKVLGEVGLGLGLRLGGSGSRKRVRRRNRSTRRRGDTLDSVSDDRVDGSEILGEVDLRKSLAVNFESDGRKASEGQIEGANPDVGLSRPGLENLGSPIGGEGSREGLERARSPSVEYKGGLSMGSIGEGTRVDGDSGTDEGPQLPRVEGNAHGLETARGSTAPIANVLGVASRYEPRVESNGERHEYSSDSAAVPVYSGICLDSGTTEDVLGHDECPNASNVTTLDKAIPCETMMGVVDIEERGDIKYSEDLETKSGLMAPWSTMTLLSLTQRMSEGWKFVAEGTMGLLSRGGKEIRFRVDEGLLKLVRESDERGGVGDREREPRVFGGMVRGVKGMFSNAKANIRVLLLMLTLFTLARGVGGEVAGHGMAKAMSESIGVKGGLAA